MKTEFHIIFTYLKVLLFFDFFKKTFKNRKPVFIYKNSVRFEPVDCNLTSPASHQKGKKKIQIGYKVLNERDNPIKLP